MTAGRLAGRRRLSVLLALTLLVSTTMASAQSQIGAPQPKKDPPLEAVKPPPPPESPPLPADQRYPSREVGTGMKYGFLFGTLAGATAGAIAILIIEIEEDDLVFGEKALVTGFLALTGAATGGLLGA
ncbi:MAG: hypothetical protein FD129_1881, partial [bacterium]